MPKRFVTALLLTASAPVFAAAMQPGEWEFNATTTSPLFATAQSSVFKYCVTKEDAENPERWMARQSEKGECRLTPGERTSLEGEMKLSGNFQGHAVQMSTRMSGKRLGPCKS